MGIRSTDQVHDRLDAPGGIETAPPSILEEFVAVIAHELSTPLAVVSTAVALALEDGSQAADPERRHLLEMIRRNTDLASLLLERLSLARDIEADTVELHRETVDLGQLVRDSVDDLRHVILGDHPVDVTVHGSSIVHADATVAREIVFNLLSNAAKYSHAGAQIVVNVEVSGTNVQITVRNHGSGVTPGDSDAIFDKFVQGDTRSPGAGLGLYISRGLARAHGGDITVRPAADVGSVFELTLPIGR